METSTDSTAGATVHGSIDRMREVTADMQGQWYNHGSGSDTKAYGLFDVPNRMTKKRCLEWNYTADPDECVRYETWSQVQHRVAEDHLADTFFFRNGDSREEWVPAEAWAEAVR